MFDYENYTLEDMYIKGRDDAFFYRGNATMTITQYLFFKEKPSLIKAKISNYIVGYKLGIIELNFKNMGFNVEFNRNDLKLYYLNKKEKVEVLNPKLKEALRNLSLKLADEEVERILNESKCRSV